MKKEMNKEIKKKWRQNETIEEERSKEWRRKKFEKEINDYLFLDCGREVREFELQLCYDVFFRTNSHEKGCL